MARSSQPHYSIIEQKARARPSHGYIKVRIRVRDRFTLGGATADSRWVRAERTQQGRIERRFEESSVNRLIMQERTRVDSAGGRSTVPRPMFRFGIGSVTTIMSPEQVRRSPAQSLAGWAGGKSELHRVVCPVTRGARDGRKS